MHTHDIIIIGAWAAGIGMWILLEKCGVKNYIILERNKIGSSFTSWPAHTRFISPSFCGNFFNAVDLNAVSPDTSPAYTLATEHPSGKQYAEYLQASADFFKVKVQEGIEVEHINKKDDIFHIHTNKESFTSTFVVRAGGEFQQPNDTPFPWSEHCIHSSKTDTFDEDEYVIIGGYESGLELAAHLLSLGKKVAVVDEGTPWEVNVSDSSISVAPSTKDRLSPYIGSDDFGLYNNKRVTEVIKKDDGYEIILEDESYIPSPTKPILATGFKSLPSMMLEHFMYDEDNNIILSEHDESTLTPWLFLTGPRVKHGNAIFCFIYKFRQRLPVVAEYILWKLGLDTQGIEEYKEANVYLKDLSCCEDECVC